MAKNFDVYLEDSQHDVYLKRKEFDITVQTHTFDVIVGKPTLDIHLNNRTTSCDIIVDAFKATESIHVSSSFVIGSSAAFESQTSLGVMQDTIIVSSDLSGIYENKFIGATNMFVIESAVSAASTKSIGEVESSAVLDVVAEFISGRPRTIGEMDSSTLSVFGDMTLDDVYFVTE